MNKSEFEESRAEETAFDKIRNDLADFQEMESILEDLNRPLPASGQRDEDAFIPKCANIKRLIKQQYDGKDYEAALKKKKLAFKQQIEREAGDDRNYYRLKYYQIGSKEITQE